MTPSQCRGVAAGFLHQLQTTPELFDEWLATPKSDLPAICALIARSMGLAQVPTETDLDTMAKYIDASLSDFFRDPAARTERTPRHVGDIALTQHTDDVERTPRHVGDIALTKHTDDVERTPRHVGDIALTKHTDDTDRLPRHVGGITLARHIDDVGAIAFTPNVVVSES
jgi:hypothetical protein